jgi:ATP-dependent DNA helicase RecQ
MNHVVEVLTGADTDKIRRWSHEKLSTYGIGKEHTRQEWGAIGRELVRLGYLRQTTEKFSTLELTEEGRAVLSQRKSVTLTKPVAAPETKTHRAGEISCDEVLFEHLRQVRKTLADERAVPSYIIFSDVSLRQMARNYPGNEQEFARISGVGEKKLQEFGETFLSEIAAHLQSSPRQIFAEETFVAPPAPKPHLNPTSRETLKYFQAGETVEAIARQRGFAVSTIYGHLATAFEAGEQIDLGKLFTAEDEKQILAAFEKFGFGNIGGTREALGNKFDYGLLRIVRAMNQRG